MQSKRKNGGPAAVDYKKTPTQVDYPAILREQAWVADNP